MADLLLLGLAPSLCREASESFGTHFEGLGAAARHLHRCGRIDSKLKRRLIEVEVGYNLTRHVTAVSCQALALRLRHALAETGGAGNTAEGSRPKEGNVHVETGTAGNGASKDEETPPQGDTPQTGTADNNKDDEAPAREAAEPVAKHARATKTDKGPVTTTAPPSAPANSEGGGTTEAGQKAGEKAGHAAGEGEGHATYQPPADRTLEAGVRVRIKGSTAGGGDTKWVGEIGTAIELAPAPGDQMAYWAISFDHGKVREFPEYMIEVVEDKGINGKGQAEGTANKEVNHKGGPKEEAPGPTEQSQGSGGPPRTIRASRPKRNRVSPTRTQPHPTGPRPPRTGRSRTRTPSLPQVCGCASGTRLEPGAPGLAP